ncbi:hypothetical protein [Kitasatospora griseola]|uniref:hypothetical protein n=1 Tax=Kitasatospora griseola TaxID=2064 RepID=UPI00382027CC
MAGIRANVLVPDHLDPVAGPALRRLGTVEDALGRLRSVHTGWRDAAALLVGPEEKVRQVLLRVEDLRAAEAWPHAARFAAGPLPELAVFVTPRVGVVLPDREAQVRAATDRIGSAFGRASTVTASTAAAPPPGHRRSR